MLKKFSTLLIAVLFFGSLGMVCDFADAARLGGGRSFGSKPSYQRSAPQPASPQRDAGRATQDSRQSQAAPGQAAPRPAVGGLRGMLGGLLMGTLIGSLLFGGGFAGFGMLDFLIIAGLLFLAFRFIRSRRAAYEAAGGMNYGGQTRDYSSQPSQGGGAGYGFNWGDLAGEQGGAAPAGPEVPPGFDAEDFLGGARAAYTRLQESWDRRDLDDIRQFTSPEVWEEIRRQAQHDPGPGKTEILLINSRLLEVKQQDGETVASVYFDVLMREDHRDQPPHQVREVWHFSRDDNEKSFWKLEGIQQLE